MRTSLMPYKLGATLLFACPTALAAPYPECTSEPTASDVTAAKGAFQAGQASFNEADYETAITYWEDAYRRDCTAHAMLLNLARAYELSDNPEQAVEALQTYLVRQPETPQKDQISRRIEVLNQKLEKPKGPPVVEPAPAEPEPSKPEAPPEPVAVEAVAVQPTPVPENDNHWVGPMIVGGAGVLLAGGGVLLYSVGSIEEQEAADACPSRDLCDPETGDKGNAGILKEKIGVGLMIGGAASIGAGIAWYLLTAPNSQPTGPKDSTAQELARGRRASQLWLVPELGSEHAGLSLLGRF